MSFIFSNQFYFQLSTFIFMSCLKLFIVKFLSSSSCVHLYQLFLFLCIFGAKFYSTKVALRKILELYSNVIDKKQHGSQHICTKNIRDEIVWIFWGKNSAFLMSMRTQAVEYKWCSIKINAIYCDVISFIINFIRYNSRIA